MSQEKTTKIWQKSAPSNIALIKYMGKTNSQKNIPANASLSYTLNHLKTFVQLELIEDNDTGSVTDVWEPLTSVQGESLYTMELSEKGQQRFLKHLKFLKEEFSIKDKAFKILSANNFPSDCGIASSASSFAALTLVAHTAATDINKDSEKEIKMTDYNLEALANLSRQASGSSCRSMFAPWCQWKDKTISEFQFKNFYNLYHQVIIVDGSLKKVSSSQAHSKVTQSLVFKGRVARAEERLSYLKKYIDDADWRGMYNTCWAEFWDMHCLFETAQEPFGYMTGDSLNLLNKVRGVWQNRGDGPVVTMDAGANIHLLYREDQLPLAKELAKDIKSENQNYSIMTNYESVGGN